MNNLFIIDGAPATGKTSLINYIKKTYQNEANIIKKYTTRMRRIEEQVEVNQDLLFLSKDDITSNLEQNCYSYLYGGYKYFINKKDFEESLINFKNTFFILRNTELIQLLTKEYNDKVHVVPILIFANKELVTERLKKEGYKHNEIISRLERSGALSYDSITNVQLYKEIIINNYDFNHFFNSINSILQKYI